MLLMYAGRIVESASTAQIFDELKHPYNQALQICAGEMRNIDNRLEGNCARPFFGLLTNPIKGDRFRVCSSGGEVFREQVNS